MRAAMRRPIALLVVFALVTPAVGAEDSATIIARGRYEEGKLYFQKGDYVRALDEFEAARAAKALPAFDYNIGVCHERRREIELAVAAYRRYLAAEPPPSDAREVRAHVALLEASRVLATKVDLQEHALPAEPPPASPRRSGRFTTGAVLAALGGGALIVAAGVLGAAQAEFDRENLPPDQGGCRPCDPQVADALRTKQYAGWVVLGVGAALTAVDAIVWALAALRSK
jgi:iron complex outermembrane receptor protein